MWESNYRRSAATGYERNGFRFHQNPYLRERAAARKERRTTNNGFSSDARQNARRNGNSPKRNVNRSLFRFIFQTIYSPRQ